MHGIEDRRLAMRQVVVQLIHPAFELARHHLRFESARGDAAQRGEQNRRRCVQCFERAVDRALISFLPDA